MNLFDLIAEVQWFQGNGDPTLMGDVTVLAYAITAVFCFIAAWKSRSIVDNHKKHQLFWFGVGLLFVFFAFNKHTNFQSGFTSFFRTLAYESAWYDVRQSVQIPFIVGVLIVTAVLLLLASWILRPIWQDHKLTIVGVAYQLAFVAIRASSLHAMDGIINFTFAGIRMNWVLEFVGILIVAGTAVHFWRTLRKEAPQLKVASAE